MAPIWFQQLEHASVRAPRLTGKRPTDEVRQVVIARGDGIAVTKGNRRNLGRGPGTDTGDAEEAAARFLRWDQDQLVEAVGDGCGVADYIGFAPFDAVTMKGPVGGSKQPLGGWRQEQPGVSRGWLAQRPNHGRVGRSRLDAGYLLFQHGWYERLEYRLRPAEAHARVSPVDFEKQRMPRVEGLGTVVKTEQGGRRRDCPTGSRPPGSDSQRRKTEFDEGGGRPLGSPACPPRFACLDPGRRIPRTAALKHAQGQPQIEGARNGELERFGPHMRSVLPDVRLLTMSLSTYLKLICVSSCELIGACQTEGVS